MMCFVPPCKISYRSSGKNNLRKGGIPYELRMQAERKYLQRCYIHKIRKNCSIPKAIVKGKKIRSGSDRLSLRNDQSDVTQDCSLRSE